MDYAKIQEAQASHFHGLMVETSRNGVIVVIALLGLILLFYL